MRIIWLKKSFAEKNAFQKLEADQLNAAAHALAANAIADNIYTAFSILKRIKKTVSE